MAQVIVLGTMQDGGLPQLGCDCHNCLSVLQGSQPRRYVASLGIMTAQGTLLVDATPDIAFQYHLLCESFGKSPMNNGKSGLGPISGVLISHLHSGHYIGLLSLGKEVVSTHQLPIYATEEVSHFLQSNKPFSYLLSRQQILFKNISPNHVLEMGDGVTLMPFEVPHRNEDGNTIGLEITNPETCKTLIYIPDVDYLDNNIVGRVKKASHVLMDGTFYSKSEIDRQKMVPHPTMLETIKIFGIQTTGQFFFTHLNHSNPVNNPESLERKQVEEKGYRIAQEGQLIEF